MLVFRGFLNYATRDKDIGVESIQVPPTDKLGTALPIVEFEAPRSLLSLGRPSTIRGVAERARRKGEY